MYIESWEKAKDGKTVLGYTFRYQYNDKDGFIAWRGTDGQLSGGLNPKNKNKTLDTVILPEYEVKASEKVQHFIPYNRIKASCRFRLG